MLCIFLSPLLTQSSLVVLIFDVLRSVSGNAVLQINALGGLEDGRNNGVLEFLATSGHMRRMQPGNETPPHDRLRWLGSLSDFVVARPWLGATTLFESDKCNIDSTPWLTCRKCRRKDKGPIDSANFYQASKFTTNWPHAIILENTRTGGYPIPDDPKLGPVNKSVPIRTLNWMDASLPIGLVTGFRQEASQPLSLLQVRRTDRRGMILFGIADLIM